MLIPSPCYKNGFKYQIDAQKQSKQLKGHDNTVLMHENVSSF